MTSAPAARLFSDNTSPALGSGETGLTVPFRRAVTVTPRGYYLAGPCLRIVVQCPACADLLHEEATHKTRPCRHAPIARCGGWGRSHPRPGSPGMQIIERVSGIGFPPQASDVLSGGVPSPLALSAALGIGGRIPTSRPSADSHRAPLVIKGGPTWAVIGMR